MKLKKRLSALFLCVLLFAHAASAEDVIRIKGSNTLGRGMVPVLVEAWMKKIGYDNITKSVDKAGLTKISAKRDGETLLIEIDGKGSHLGFQDLVNGETEIAMMSRAVNAKERDEGWQLGAITSADQEHVVGLQAITPVVNSANPITSLDQQQLNKILSGQINNWQQLGGRPGAIKLHVPRKGTGLAELQNAVLSTRITAAKTVFHADSKAIVAAVAADTMALGIAEFDENQKTVNRLSIRIADRLIPADPLHIKSEDYPLTRRLYFYTGQLVTALGRGFLLYAMSDEGQRALSQKNYLSLTPALYKNTAEKALPKDYAEWVDGAAQLSFTLRFGNEFSIFDSRGEQDLSRLKEFMRHPENKNRKVILVGHSEKQASSYQALSISNEYADLVAHALNEIGITASRVRGIGQALPLTVAGNGVYRNRRVEVWLQ